MIILMVLVVLLVLILVFAIVFLGIVAFPIILEAIDESRGILEEWKERKEDDDTR